MDPHACLLAAESAISDGQDEVAAQHLDDYVNWRGNGGFEPNVNMVYKDEQVSIYSGSIRGDYFHRALITRYETKFGSYLDGRLP